MVFKFVFFYSAEILHKTMQYLCLSHAVGLHSLLSASWAVCWHSPPWDLGSPPCDLPLFIFLMFFLYCRYRLCQHFTIFMSSKPFAFVYKVLGYTKMLIFCSFVLSFRNSTLKYLVTIHKFFLVL